VQVPDNPPPVIAYTAPLVIVGGGTIDIELLRALYVAGAHLVGADAGGDVIAAAGLRPEAIIGDFDSLADPDAWLGRTQLVRVSEQDTTDFEKALYSTSAPLTIALGMTGGRFDHTLAALDAVARQAVGRSIILVDERDLALALSGPFGFEVGAGERVSVHPLVPIRFRRSTGLRYPLDGLRLAVGERSGSSNEATEGPFSIEPEDDGQPWMLIVERRHLAEMVKAIMAGGERRPSES
jgi:thiamine pyrophosphokinase